MSRVRILGAVLALFLLSAPASAQCVGAQCQSQLGIGLPGAALAARAVHAERHLVGFVFGHERRVERRQARKSGRGC